MQKKYFFYPVRIFNGVFLVKTAFLRNLPDIAKKNLAQAGRLWFKYTIP